MQKDLIEKIHSLAKDLLKSNIAQDSFVTRSGVVNTPIPILGSEKEIVSWYVGITIDAYLVGYLQFDALPFIKSAKVDSLMNYLSLKVGDMEVNYGDEHFRRSDNGNVTNNPFVGNYIMDAFMTSPSLEILFRKDGIIAMGGMTAGTLNPSLVKFSNNTYTAYDATRYLGYYWKLGYDRQFNDDFRGRLTLSGYHAPKNYSGSLYNGDRTGSRYYLVMKRITDSSSDVDITSNHITGRWGPGTTNKDNSLMANLFLKEKGLEFFGTYEHAGGTYLSGNEFRFNQYAAEGLYRFGSNEQYYGGVRYNYVKGSKNVSGSDFQSINRVQVAAGWFILESTLLKIEYVNQNYNNFITDYGANAGFKGVMVEAAVTF